MIPLDQVWINFSRQPERNQTRTCRCPGEKANSMAMLTRLGSEVKVGLALDSNGTC